MAEKHQKKKRDEEQQRFRDEIGKKEKRMVNARKKGRESVWFGLGMFGLVGWSVAIPTIMGIAVGVWVDKQWPHATISWTLTCLVIGAALGCWNAWYWVQREHDTILKKKDNNQREL